MNIFLFDPLNLKLQAQAHPDKLVVKMQLEASQLLANALSSLYDLSLPKKDSTPFKLTHYLLRAKTSYAEWRFSKPPEFWSVGAKLSEHHGRFCRIVFKG